MPKIHFHEESEESKIEILSEIARDYDIAVRFLVEHDVPLYDDNDIELSLMGRIKAYGEMIKGEKL